MSLPWSKKTFGLWFLKINNRILERILFLREKILLCCQTGLELLDWKDPPASSFYIAGAIDGRHVPGLLFTTCAVEKINLRHLFSSVKGDEVLLQSFSKKKALLQEKTLTGLLIYWPPQWNHCIYLMIFFMPKNQQKCVVLFLLGFIPSIISGRAGD